MKRFLIILSIALYPAFALGNSDYDSFYNSITHHANLNDKLRFIMLKLQSELNSSRHQDLSQDQPFNDNIQDLISITESLIENTDFMKTGSPDLNLDEKELKIFQSMAHQLHADALNLYQVTNEHEYQRIETAYQQLRQTCTSCHRLFRDEEFNPTPTSNDSSLPEE